VARDEYFCSREWRSEMTAARFMEIVMDSYRQDSAYSSISSLSDTHFGTLTSDETNTYRRWRRAILAFYCSLLLLGGLAVGISTPIPDREVAQVSSPRSTP
jgi:hypothetical protein